MLNSKTKLFTIGQFAALHEINKKTLMWYDEVGLFKPAVLGENNYRYYTYHQSSVLETILMLRELGVSINEITEFMKNRSADALNTLLKEKIREVDKKILHMKAVRKTLEARQAETSALLTLNLSEISIVEQEEKYLAIIHTDADMPLEKEIEAVVAETKKYHLNRLYDASYGSMLSAESLYAGDLENYSALFIEIPGSKEDCGLHVRPKGKYLRAYCKGSWDKLPEKYKEILSYAKNHGLTLMGHAYETGVNESMIDSMEEYITQIDIPVN